MEPKKNKKYDLERKSPLFYSIGLVVALICVATAFEWKSEYDPIDLSVKQEIFDEVYVVPITEIRSPKPPEPKPLDKVKKPNLQPPIIIETDEVNIDPAATEDIPDIPFDDIIIEDPVDDVDIPEETPFIVVESMPKFPGGEKAIYKFISDHIKYPTTAKRLGIQGKVIVEFIIDQTGLATNVRVLKGIGGGCDEEAVRVIELLTKFEPGKQRGRAVKVKQVIPISFKLPY